MLQVWDVGIRGLTAGRALRIETAAGAVLQTVQVTESGGAAWSGVVDGGTSLSMYTFAAGHAGGQSVPSMPSVASVASSMPSVASIPSIPSMRSVAQAPSAAQGAYAPPPKLTLANLESTLARLKAKAGAGRSRSRNATKRKAPTSASAHCIRSSSSARHGASKRCYRRAGTTRGRWSSRMVAAPRYGPWSDPRCRVG